MLLVLLNIKGCNLNNYVEFVLHYLIQAGWHDIWQSVVSYTRRVGGQMVIPHGLCIHVDQTIWRNLSFSCFLTILSILWRLPFMGRWVAHGHSYVLC